MNGLELIINDVEKSLNNECLFSALALALTIPDVCGKISYPNKKPSDRYINWFDEHIGNYEKCPDERSKGMPYLSGELCYALRCSYLHGGDTNIAKKYSNFTLDNFILITESKKPSDIYADSSSLSNNLDGKTTAIYEINIRRLCCLLVWCAKSFLKRSIENSLVLPDIKIKDYDNELLELRILHERNNSMQAHFKNAPPTTHQMHLNNESFNMIKFKIKTIELRLDDDKRNTLKTNDLIKFTNVNTQEIITVKIIKLYHFKNFEDLYNAFENKTILGYNENDKPSPKDMLKYYKQEDINLYGTIGIEIEVL